MANPIQELNYLNQLEKIFNDEENSSVVILENAYVFALNRVAPTYSAPEIDWTEIELDRAILVIAQIVPRYVDLYFDPRSFPVTHAQRQKTLAIHLDTVFSKLLWKKIVFQKVPELFQEGVKISDPFLDEPILFMKQEARGKLFSKNKRGELTHPEMLSERFHEKLIAKGIRNLGEIKTEKRFEYGP